jgi:hypothetical protein
MRAMKRTNVIIACAVSAVLLGSFAGLLAYPKFKKIEKRGPAPASVAAILPDDVNVVAALIGSVFNEWSDFDRPDRIGKYQNKFPDGNRWNRFFLFRKDAQRSSFPSDEEILLDRGADSFVERYVGIGPELRARDFYLYEPTGDYYWASEYFYDGRPAQFRCGFLIHLEPTGKSATKAEVFEYQPEIWAGEYFGFSAHAVWPVWLHDIRSVEATTADREDLLRLIEASARATSKTGD